MSITWMALLWLNRKPKWAQVAGVAAQHSPKRVAMLAVTTAGISLLSCCLCSHRWSPTCTT